MNEKTKENLTESNTDFNLRMFIQESSKELFERIEGNRKELGELSRVYFGKSEKELEEECHVEDEKNNSNKPKSNLGAVVFTLEDTFFMMHKLMDELGDFTKKL